MARNARIDERDDDEEIVQKDSFYQRIPKVVWIILICLIIVGVSLLSVFLTVKYIKYNQNINKVFINKYIEALELKTAYGYKHPEQKIDINLVNYAKNYIINPNNKECGKESQLILKPEENNLSFMNCEFIESIKNDDMAKNITLYVPKENNTEIFSNNYSKYSTYYFFIDFNDGDDSLLDYDWILVDRQGRNRSYEFCSKYKNICKYSLLFNNEDFKEFK